MERTHFHNELDKLRVKVLEMAAYAQKAADDACRALIERDADLAQQVIDNDHVINELENEIDEYALRLLALDQPMAVDLRSIVGIQNASTNLERVGDQAVNIAEKVMFLSTRPPLKYMDNLTELSEVALDMLRMSIQALKQSDSDLCREICRTDQECNALDVKVLKELIDYISREAPAAERAVHTILVSRSLERIGDLATNIAEVVVFIVEGENIKHRVCK